MGIGTGFTFVFSTSEKRLEDLCKPDNLNTVQVFERQRPPTVTTFTLYNPVVAKDISGIIQLYCYLQRPPFLFFCQDLVSVKLYNLQDNDGGDPSDLINPWNEPSERNRSPRVVTFIREPSGTLSWSRNVPLGYYR